MFGGIYFAGAPFAGATSAGTTPGFSSGTQVALAASSGGPRRAS